MVWMWLQCPTKGSCVRDMVHDDPRWVDLKTGTRSFFLVSTPRQDPDALGQLPLPSKAICRKMPGKWSSQDIWDPGTCKGRIGQLNPGVRPRTLVLRSFLNSIPELCEIWVPHSHSGITNLLLAHLFLRILPNVFDDFN